MTTSHAIEFGLPIDCDVGRNCVIQQYVDHDSSSKARDYQCGTLTYDGHNGTDFRLPNLAARRAGINVLAAAVELRAIVRNGRLIDGVLERVAAAGA